MKAAQKAWIRGDGQPTIVGILNVTPDSFSDGGAWPTVDAQIAAGERLVAEGAEIVEVGGESTRPGAAAVPQDEELRRVMPVIKELRRRLEVPLGVDTSKAEVAQQALGEGVQVVNDVTALRADPAMAAVLRTSRARVVLMHMRGTPRTMQEHPSYVDVLAEIEAFLAERISYAEEQGIDPGRIIVDPGIGFGKRVSDNLRILRDVDRLHSLGCPIMIGASRKSFIGAVTDRSISQRAVGTCIANVFALLGGATFLRVHDPAYARDVVRLCAAIRDGATGYDEVTAHGCAR